MINRPLYVRKYHSGRLKEFGWSVDDTFEDSRRQNEIIGLSDNQMMRTIRDIDKRDICKRKLEILIKTRDMYRKKLTYQQKHPNKELIKKLKSVHKRVNNKVVDRLWDKYISSSTYDDEVKRIQGKIYRITFQEDYVTVVMDNNKHYEYLYENGFYINGKLFRRLSCPAGKARVSTVIFCREEIIDEVRTRLDNGRNLNKKFSPSKFNAYFGLYGSSTTVVSDPKFIVVKDYENTTSFMANWVIENGWKVDDTIIQKEIVDTPMNRTDGMGIISYRQAAKWASEMGLDYVPSQFCVRQSYIKGMLCVFPIHEFAEEYGKLDEFGKCMVDTIYTDSNGNPIKANLFDYDVIISESQFKLWDSYDNIDSYLENCKKNKLYWGVALTSPKEAKHMLKLNYQFIQTLKLKEKDIEKLASQFVEWMSGVSYQNRYYMLLFLLGVNNDEKKIKQFLSSSDNYWVKALIINDNVKNDKYIRTKIRELIKHKIENACKGDIYVDGNFQVIVSDPFGFMQHVCGLEVTGLLKPGMSYSNYWNERNVVKVDAMRSPLTYLSEHVILNLQKDNETERWYRYCKLGIILNYHGHEAFNFAGSDFDMDILATTSNEVMMNGVYKEELPVVYDAPKPNKFVFTEDDLYKSDTFSFGSIIGSITNKSSNGYALLPLIEEKYGIDSQEYKLVKTRLQQCCKAQSAQIDKAKIGRAVKGIPKVWTNRNKFKRNKNGNIVDKHLRRKELYNSTLLDVYPYFFRYVYKDTNKKYKKYLDEKNGICKQKFNMSFTELESLQRKTDVQKKFIEDFYRYCPVTISNSSMNMLCQYIESINFNISQNTKIDTSENVYELYKNKTFDYSEYYNRVVNELKKYMQERRFEMTIISPDENDEDEYNENKVNSSAFGTSIDDLVVRMSKINNNPQIILNCLIDYFYKEKPVSNKDILWKSYGKYIYQNIVKNTESEIIIFPFPTNENDFDLTYLGYNYKLQEVQI